MASLTKWTWVWASSRSWWWTDRLSKGTNKTLCAPQPRRKEQCPHKRLTQICLWGFRSLWQRRGMVVACCRVGGTACSNVCMGPLEGGRYYLHYLHHSLASDQITGREHSPAHQQKVGLKIYWAGPIRTRPSFPHSQSLPSGSFHKPLILLHQWADRMKTTVTEN